MYTDQDFCDAVKASGSIRQVLLKIGLAPRGGNYATFHKKVLSLGISTKHFHGQGWSNGKRFGPRVDIQQYLSNEQPIQSYKLKNKLLASGLKKRRCECCELTTWRNSNVPLELHHVDGNSNNNSLDNLQLLCPNCHALTKNYRGKAMKV